jgi:hypothetical protein
MRPTVRPFVCLPVALVAVVLAGPVGTGPFVAPAAAQEPADACAERLDAGTRTAHRFRYDGRALSWARVVVTETAADADRYCVEVRFGGRKPTHRTSTRGYERRAGRWVEAGGDGGGAEPKRSYTETVQVRDGRRTDRRYEIRSGGDWYRAAVSLRNP